MSTSSFFNLHDLAGSLKENNLCNYETYFYISHTSNNGFLLMPNDLVNIKFKLYRSMAFLYYNYFPHISIRLVTYQSLSCFGLKEKIPLMPIWIDKSYSTEKQQINDESKYNTTKLWETPYIPVNKLITKNCEQWIIFIW